MGEGLCDGRGRTMLDLSVLGGLIQLARGRGYFDFVLQLE